MKKSEKMYLKCVVYESTLSTAFPETQPLTKGEGKEEAASPHFQKRYYSNTFFPVRS